MLTITAVAEFKKIGLEDVRVKIARLSDAKNNKRTNFDISIEFTGTFSDRETILLFNSARNCDVQKLLNGQLAFDYHLVNKDE